MKHDIHYILYGKEDSPLTIHFQVANMSKNEIQQNGWTSVPLDPSILFGGEPFKNRPGPLLVADIKFPNDDPIVVKVQSYAQERLPIQTFNHSMRVFYFGMVI